MSNVPAATETTPTSSDDPAQAAPPRAAEPADAFRAWTVRTELPVSFLIKRSPDIFHPENLDLLRVGPLVAGSRRLIVVDAVVAKIYGHRIEAYFDHHSLHCEILPVDAGEINKSPETLFEVMGRMESFGILRRSEPLIVVGGGVVLDVAGLAASLYRRGVPYVRVPTTLMAMVDASVGAKSAVNCFDRRNRVGAYYPPTAVYIDNTFVISQEPREISNGAGEILKMAVVRDLALFELLEEHAHSLILGKFQGRGAPIQVMDLAVGDMIEELQPNLWERNLERLVDFGHSFSPLVEMRALPELLHGEAVALDVLFSCVLSHQRGLLSRAELERVFAAARSLGLPIFHPLFGDDEVLAEALADTVRHRNGSQNLPLPTAIGTSVFANDITFNEIRLAARSFRGYSQRL
ncbi:MAG: sedoheptulose 7-phosphate cyclase [Myxococcales bacterium FL481]|nr:MAG: sedoheptulose 7-phosphate cyclase [Myxococcales bacterium FL481]